MRLRRVERVSFCRSEATNFCAVPEAVRAKLGPDDVVCFVSMTGQQLIFVYGFHKTGGKPVLRSARLRLSSGTWNPLMLANYAREVGLTLDGLQRFEQLYKEIAS